LPRPQRMEAAPRGAWDWMDPPKKIQRVSNVSPKPNKTVENILNDGTICNYDFWNCSYVFDSSKSLFYHIISSRHKPIKKHLEVLQVPFCHYRTIVLWQLSQVVSHCIPIFPYIFRVTLWGYLTVIYSWPCTLCIFMYFSGGTSSENGIILGSHNFDPPRSAFKVYLEAQSPAGSWWILQTGVVCSSETAKRLRGSDRLVWWWFCRIKGCCGISLYHRQIVLVIVLVIVSRFLLVKLDVWWNLMSDETGLFLFPTFWHNSIWLSSLSWSCPEKLGFNQRLFLRCSFSLSNPIHPKFRDPKINWFNTQTYKTIPHRIHVWYVC
jgi:hypothetical protein